MFHLYSLQFSSRCLWPHNRRNWMKVNVSLPTDSPWNRPWTITQLMNFPQLISHKKVYQSQLKSEFVSIDHAAAATKNGELKNHGATLNVSRKSYYAWLRANVDTDEWDVEPLNLRPPLPTDVLIIFPSFTHFHCFDKYSKSSQVNCMLERYKQRLVAFTIWR